MKMTRKKNKVRFGALPPIHHFMLNPYPEMRLTSCPWCHEKTGQRKRPLLIHIEPQTMIALNYTNRFCKACDLLIGHKHEIEHYLTEMFARMNPSIIGNPYLIFATVKRKAWQTGMRQSIGVQQMRAHVSDFKSYQELRMTQGGWCEEGQEPPLMEPPEPRVWVKR